MASIKKLKEVEDSLKRLLQRETPESFRKWLINKRKTLNNLKKNKQVEVIMEIERWWVVKEIPKQLGLVMLDYTPTTIEQWYISKRPVLRLRVENGKKYIFCIKTEPLIKTSGIGKPEIETEINKNDFNNLMRLVNTEAIIKTRYHIPFEDYMLEFDIFHEDLTGLFKFEMEFPTEEAAAAFQAPNWFGKEVTGNKKYANSYLAKDLKQRSAYIRSATET